MVNDDVFNDLIDSCCQMNDHSILTNDFLLQIKLRCSFVIAL